MTKKELRNALRTGQPVFGIMVASDSPAWPDQVVQMGLDFVFIDTEHVPIERKSLAWMCHAYSSIGLPPIVRIQACEPCKVAVALDAGAAGVMAPYVETVEQVRDLIGAVKMRPLKGRRLHDVLYRGAALEPELAAYLKEKSGDNILMINVESQPAVANLDELLSQDGLDGVMIGPHDLSINLGVPERYDAPVFDAAVRNILRGARRHGVAAGVFSMLGVQRVIDWTADGLHFVVHGADHYAMRDAVAEDVRVMRRHFDTLNKQTPSSPKQ